MATFSDLVKLVKIDPVYMRKQVALNEMDKIMKVVAELDKESPNIRAFERIEKQADEAAKAVKDASRELDKLLLKANPDILSEDNYLADQTYERKKSIELYNVIDEYADIIKAKGIQYPPVIKSEGNDSDLKSVLQSQQELLSTLVKSQEASAKSQQDLAEKLVKSQNESQKAHTDSMKELANSNSRSAPRPTQPFFNPKDNEKDYMNYRDFKPRFLHFVTSVKNESQKLEWLISSVTGEAHNLIGKLDLIDTNYKVALDKLDKKYLNSDFVEQSLLSTVYNFKIDPKIILNKVPSAITSLTNTLDTLKDIYKMNFFIYIKAKLQASFKTPTIGMFRDWAASDA